MYPPSEETAVRTVLAPDQTMEVNSRGWQYTCVQHVGREARSLRGRGHGLGSLGGSGVGNIVMAISKGGVPPLCFGVSGRSEIRHSTGRSEISLWPGLDGRQFVQCGQAGVIGEDV